MNVRSTTRNPVRPKPSEADGVVVVGLDDGLDGGVDGPEPVGCEGWLGDGDVGVDRV
jgi:hypothetical protein